MKTFDDVSRRAVAGGGEMSSGQIEGIGGFWVTLGLDVA